MATATQQVENGTPEVDQETGKFIHVYQPRDSEGQFIGKPYRFLYTDHMDLVKQLEQAKEHGDRFIHEVKTGKRKLVGEPATPQPDFKAAAEPAEEQQKKRREEFRRTAEEEFGAPIEEVRQTLRMQRETSERLIAQNWAMNKEAEGYYPCPENARKMSQYLGKEKLKACPENYDLAFEALKDELVPRPQEQSADSTQQPPTRAEVKPSSTGIIPGQFAGTRQPGRTEKLPLSRERFRQ